MKGMNFGKGTGSSTAAAAKGKTAHNTPGGGKGGAKIKGKANKGGYKPQTTTKNKSYTPQSKGGRKEYSPDRDYNYAPQAGPMKKDGDYEPQSKGGRSESTPQSQGGRKEYTPQSAKGNRKGHGYMPQRGGPMRKDGDYAPQSKGGRKEYTPQSSGREDIHPATRSYSEQRPQSEGYLDEYTPQSAMKADEDYMPQSRREGGDYSPQSGGRKEYTPQSGGREEYTPQSAMQYEPQSRGGGSDYSPQSRGGGKEYTPQSRGGRKEYTPQSDPNKKFKDAGMGKRQGAPMRKNGDYEPQSQRSGGDYSPQSGGRKEYSPQSGGRKEYRPQSQGDRIKTFKDTGANPDAARSMYESRRKKDAGPMRKDGDYEPQSRRGGGDYEPQSGGRKEYSPQSGGRDEYTPQSQKKKVDRSPYMKKADHDESDQNNVGTFQGFDREKGKAGVKSSEHYDTEYWASDEWSGSDEKKKYNANIRAYMDGGKSLEDARALADKDFWASDKGKEVKDDRKTKQNRDYAWNADSNMTNLVSRRNELRDSGDTSSKEYQEIQNRINKSYGNSTRHGKTTNTTTSKDGRSSTTTTHTPGVGTQETKTVYDKDGNPKKVKHNDTRDDYYGGEKTKTKYKGDDVANFKDEDGDGHPDAYLNEATGGLDADTIEGDTKTKQRKKYKDTKVGKSKIGRLFVSKKNR